MPVVRISWWKGRTIEQKAKVARAVEDSMVNDAGCKPGDTHVIFEDHEKSNWALKGELQG